MRFLAALLALLSCSQRPPDMSTQPIFGPKARFFDANGHPLSGGLLYTYSAGTTNPLATYTTRAGDVANANPVVLNAQGEADIWGTDGLSYKLVLKDSAGVTQWTVDNVPVASDTSTSTDVAAVEPGGRLTLTNGTPVTTADVTGAGTVYYVPYKHDKVPLYDGSAWALFSIGTGLSQTTVDNTKSPAAVANNSNYDLFVWNDAGIVRLSRGPLWTSDTGRGTGVGTSELQQVNGRQVNKTSITNGPAAQRGLYVGTIRSDGSAQINDSLAKRHCWNMNNRVRRTMSALDPTGAGWAYAVNAWRQARASAANQLDFVVGLSEDAVNARVRATAVNGAASTAAVAVGIGLDSSTALAAACVVSSSSAVFANNDQAVAADWEGLPGLGRHTLVWIEISPAAVSFTFRGPSGAPQYTQPGISGALLA